MRFSQLECFFKGTLYGHLLETLRQTLAIDVFFFPFKEGILFIGPV